MKVTWFVGLLGPVLFSALVDCNGEHHFSPSNNGEVETITRANLISACVRHPTLVVMRTTAAQGEENTAYDVAFETAAKMAFSAGSGTIYAKMNVSEGSESRFSTWISVGDTPTFQFYQRGNKSKMILVPESSVEDMTTALLYPEEAVLFNTEPAAEDTPPDEVVKPPPSMDNSLSHGTAVNGISMKQFMLLRFGHKRAVVMRTHQGHSKWYAEAFEAAAKVSSVMGYDIVYAKMDVGDAKRRSWVTGEDVPIFQVLQPDKGSYFVPIPPAATVRTMTEALIVGPIIIDEGQEKMDRRKKLTETLEYLGSLVKSRRAYLSVGDYLQTTPGFDYLLNKEDHCKGTLSAVDGSFRVSSLDVMRNEWVETSTMRCTKMPRKYFPSRSWFGWGKSTSPSFKVREAMGMKGMSEEEVATYDQEERERVVMSVTERGTVEIHQNGRQLESRSGRRRPNFLNLSWLRWPSNDYRVVVDGGTASLYKGEEHLWTLTD